MIPVDRHRTGEESPGLRSLTRPEWAPLWLDGCVYCPACTAKGGATHRALCPFGALRLALSAEPEPQ